MVSGQDASVHYAPSHHTLTLWTLRGGKTLISGGQVWTQHSGSLLGAGETEYKTTREHKSGAVRCERQYNVAAGSDSHWSAVYHPMSINLRRLRSQAKIKAVPHQRRPNNGRASADISPICLIPRGGSGLTATLASISHLAEERRAREVAVPPPLLKMPGKITELLCLFSGDEKPGGEVRFRLRRILSPLSNGGDGRKAGGGNEFSSGEVMTESVQMVGERWGTGRGAEVWGQGCRVCAVALHGAKDGSYLHEATDVLPCAEVRTPSPVVSFGSPVTASCLIKENCFLTKGRKFHVEWLVKNQSLSSNLPATESNGTYGILIPSFRYTKANLQCCVRLDGNCQIVGGVEVKGGYAPPAPRNLSCLANLTESRTLFCKWDPVEDPQDIPTQYSLHIETRDPEERKVYTLSPRVYSYRVPQKDIFIFSTMQIYVTAVNSIGQATSELLQFSFMEIAKLDPPEIQWLHADENRFGCLKQSWSFPENLRWIKVTLNAEFRLTPVQSQLKDREQIFTRSVRPGRQLEICGLLHGTEYHCQMRVRYKQSPWSEWSQPKKGTTLEKAPNGRLDTWLKVIEEQPLNTVQLFWKATKQFRANGMNLSYIVSAQRRPAWKLCETNENYCVFQLPKRAKLVYLTAKNSVGRSTPITVHINKHRDLDFVYNMSASPQTDTDLLVQWATPESSGVTGYVLEWKPLCNISPAFTSFDLVSKNQSSSLLSGFQPYKPYAISVYPLFKGGIGRPKTIETYTKQKAPSEPPKLSLGAIRYSYVELQWDEIPLEHRNGIIQSYTVFCWDEEDNVKVFSVNKTQRRLVFRDLKPYSMYKAFLMVSTEGGSLNGTVVTFQTEVIDALSILLIVIPACVGVTLFSIILMFTCLTKHMQLKMCLWPIIPDPANSTIKKWIITESQQDLPSFKDIKEPMLVSLSHLSVLDLSNDDGKMKDERLWQSDGKDGSDREETSPRPSISYNDSVPYATVVFSGSYRSQPSSSSPVYLRSESTQPLLEAEEPSSPPPYENVSVRATTENDQFGKFEAGSLGEGVNGMHWEDFPLLSALDIVTNTD
ncbi:granulocyte colony-stimulating factor receptor, partial [Chanos chanos]|uniref:Granulocyte colony-stimulating factor receptor n=1 Tax=Chanos chanos TaxID=29144 RepID=A0A6J2W4M2_CHACN